MDTSLFKYQMFLAEQLEEQAKYEACLNEAILISENRLDEIHLVHEGFADKVKSAIMKIMEGLKKLWTKFVEAMDTLIKKDKAYLDKYKQIILKKTPIEANYTMYKYDLGVKALLNSPIPVFNYNTMKDSLESEEAFIAKSFPKYKPSENESFTDKVKASLRGSSEQVEIPSRQLNMTDMFNYCYTYDKIKDLIKKDLAYVEKAGQDAINMVDKMAREDKIATESYNLFEDNKYYSLMYEAYIYEEEKTENKDNKPGTEKVGNGMQREVKGGDGTTPGGTKPSQAYKGVNGDKENSKMKEEDVDGSAKAVNDRIKVYLKVCSNFIAAKLTIAEEIYKAYMSIIKTHVRDHLGNKDDNKPADSATNYNKTDENNNKKEESNNKEENKENSKVSKLKGYFSNLKNNKEEK